MKYNDLLQKVQMDEGKIVEGKTQRDAFLKAFSEHKDIHIICDYDADGLCSGLILTRLCEALGSRVRVTVGNRNDGYGIPSKLNLERGELVICADLGSNEKDRLNEIYKMTGEVPYVIDHHETEANHSHILNPPKGDFCTSGLCALLALESGLPNLNLNEIIKLGAIGTVADMCQMLNPYDFNRQIVKKGLEQFNTSDRKTGIDNLIAELKCNHEFATTDDIGFTIAPCINALGRLQEDGATKVFDILRNNGDVKLLVDKNAERKALMKTMSGLWEGLGDAPAQIVIAPEDTKKGVLGLIAQEVLKTYDVPSICVVKDGNEYTGSCRNAKGYPSMIDTLSSLEYIQVGGHDDACGIRLKAEDLEMFKWDLTRLYAGVKRKEIPTPEPLEDWKDLTKEQIYALEPFGIDFPKPYIEDVVKITNRSDYKGGWSCLTTDNGTTLFGQNLPETKKESFARVCGQLGLSTDFRGVTSKRISVSELMPEQEREISFKQKQNVVAK